MSKAPECTHQNQHREGAGVRWCSDCGKKEPTPVISPAQATFAEKQEQANRIEGKFDTLKDRVVDRADGCGAARTAQLDRKTRLVTNLPLFAGASKIA